MKMSYFCYIVECSDGTYYTGLTNDPPRREKQHNLGVGARYTRQRRPVKMVYIEEQPDLPAAMRRERAIKSLSRQRKKTLINTGVQKEHESDSEERIDGRYTPFGGASRETCPTQEN